MDEKNKRIRIAAIGGGWFACISCIYLYLRTIYKPTIPRLPHFKADGERNFYINSIFNRGDRHCVEQIRMKPIVFQRLCELFVRKELLKPSRNMSVKEQVMMFLQIIEFNMTFRTVSGRYFRSVETVHRYFRIVLQAILKLHQDLVRSPASSIPDIIMTDSRFYPYFKDCIGAIDGCHIQTKVPVEMQAKFRGRKDGTTQNVLAAVNFELQFTYVLAGWEGSAHDSRVLVDALSRSHGLKIPTGKFYLGDAGYGIRNGVITPYRGVRYHLSEFEGSLPQNAKELYNYRHSSLRTAVERSFGLLKGRFRSLDHKPFWSLETHVAVVLASCIIHNHIMEVDPDDFIMEGISTEVDSTLERRILSQRQERDESREWSIMRDSIAHSMWRDYTR